VKQVKRVILLLSTIFCSCNVRLSCIVFYSCNIRLSCIVFCSCIIRFSCILLESHTAIQEKMLFFNLAHSHSQVTNIFSENNLNSVDNSSITFNYTLNWLHIFASLLGI
jgi:hypothetical protein